MRDESPQEPRKTYFQDMQPKGWKDKAMKFVKDKIKDNLGFIFGAFTMQQLDDLYGDRYPAVRKFYRAAEAIAASTNNMMSEADKLHEKWAKLNIKDSEALASVMYKATINRIDAPAVTDEMLKKMHKSLDRSKRALRDARRYGGAFTPAVQARIVIKIKDAVKKKEARLGAAYELQSEWALLPEASKAI
jgi:hypothetical protein